MNEIKDDHYKIRDSTDWENEFINIIVQMRTIPYVLLGHFQFVNINWIDESDEEEDESSGIDLGQIEEKPINNWNLIKKMIFSKGSIAKDGKKSVDQVKSEKGASEIKVERNYSRKIVGQFNDIYHQFVGFVKSKKRSKKTCKKVDEFKESNEMSNRKLTAKKVPSPKKQTLNKKKDNTLINFDDLAKKISQHKLNSIMNKDEGPFMTDYRFLLGMEFWSNFSNVDQNELIAACARNLWSKELNEFRSFKLIDSNKRSNKNSERSCKITYLKQLKQFLKGTDRPAKAPQRVISPEEKFKLIPYPKLLNPNTDLKKTFYLNTIRDQLNKLYLRVVHLIGDSDQYPLKRKVGYEEAYEDILLWALDTHQAKTRFIALLNDQINWEID